MPNKTAENRIILGAGAIARAIKSLSSQIFSTKTSSFNKIENTNKRKAFSVAEAMIAVLIGSIALGMSAPMITKQIKFQNMTDTQLRFLTQKINRLENEFNGGGLPEDKNGINNVPSEAIMFFMNSCPDEWVDLSDKFSGRYIRISGKNEICDKDGEDKDGNCVNEPVLTETLSPGTTQQETSRRVWGSLPGNDADIVLDYEWYGVYKTWD